MLGKATFFSDDGIFGTACCGHPLAASRSQIQCHPSCPVKWHEMGIRAIALEMPCILQFTSKPEWSSDTPKKLRYEPKHSRISDLQIQLKISMPTFSPMEHFHCLN
jgi:hypothetical protein